MLYVKPVRILGGIAFGLAVRCLPFIITAQNKGAGKIKTVGVTGMVE